MDARSALILDMAVQHEYALSFDDVDPVRSRKGGRLGGTVNRDVSQDHYGVTDMSARGYVDVKAGDST